MFILEDDFNFKIRAAKLANVNTYNNRGRQPGYFRQVEKGGRTEVIVKIHHQTSFNVNKIMSYVSNKERTGGEDKNLYDAYGNPINKQRLNDIADTWNQRNSVDRKKEREQEKKTGKEKTHKTRYGTHLVFSLKEPATKSNKKILESAMREVQSKHFTSLGFDSIFTIHENTDHIHAHLLIHNKHLITRKKIRFSRNSDLFALKTDFAKSLAKQGLNYTATQRNLDSFEIKNDADKKREYRKDYLTSEIVKRFGSPARDFVKKQMIESHSEDVKKAQRAKETIALLRHYKDSSKHPQIQAKINQYLSQKEKFEIKKHLESKHPDLDRKDIHSYVDMVFAQHAKWTHSAHSNTPASINRFEQISQEYDSLHMADASKITAFAELRRKAEEQKQKVSQFNRYGLPGKELYKLLLSDIAKFESLTRKNPESDSLKQQLENSQKQLANLENNTFNPDEIVNTLIKRNSNGQTRFLENRLSYWQSEISGSAGVPKQSVDLSGLFKLYLVQRGSNPKTAYRNFTQNLNQYACFLRENDQDKLQSFHKSIHQQLDTTGSTLHQSL